jgi:hypothetical protein
MTVGKGKRPRDPNQLAKWIVDRSTDETPEPEQAQEPATSGSSTIPIGPRRDSSSPVNSFLNVFSSM